MSAMSLFLMISSMIAVALLVMKLNHLLSLLITLEYVFLLILMLFLFLSNQDQLELIGASIFLATAAAESAVALSGYVLMTRFYSKDYICNFFSSKL